MVRFNSCIDSSCRYKVVKWLKKKFDQPKSAEGFYFLKTLAVGTQTDTSCSKSIVIQTETHTTCEVGVQTTLPVPPHGTDLHSISAMFSKHCKDALQLNVPEDFLEFASSAMARLKQSERSNVVYNLAKGVSTERPDKTDSRFPVLRMPMGLVEYVTNFFIAEDINSVKTY